MESLQDIPTQKGGLRADLTAALLEFIGTVSPLSSLSLS